MCSVSPFLLQHEEIVPGDHVMIRVGYAIRETSEVEAESARQLYDEMLTAEEARRGDA